MYKTIAKVAAALAILGLILSSFALSVGAQSQTAKEKASPCASFNRDLRVGLSGAEVTTLQNWLISKGFEIKAGATGYFGGQTQAALARYQASAGITPAAGYFGPITRAKASSVCNPNDDGADDHEDDSDGDEDLVVDVEIRNGKAYVEAAIDGEDESFVLNTTNRARIVDRIADRLDVSEDEVEEVIEFVEEEDDNDDDNTVTTSATVTRTQGADSDSATFEIELDLTAHNQDIYLAEDASVSFDFDIIEGNDTVIASQTSLSKNVDSDADRQSGYFHIEEGDEERFTLTVVFDPLPTDEGKFFHMRLNSLSYNETAAAPNQTLTLPSTDTYRTKKVYISD